jgi:plasmid stabilization system protein ParE
MRIRYTPRARSDLLLILQYLDERSPPGARNVKRAIQKTIELMASIRKADGEPVNKRRACFQQAAIHT